MCLQLAQTWWQLAQLFAGTKVQRGECLQLAQTCWQFAQAYAITNFSIPTQLVALYSSLPAGLANSLASSRDPLGRELTLTHY